MHCLRLAILSSSFLHPPTPTPLPVPAPSLSLTQTLPLLPLSPSCKCGTDGSQADALTVAQQAVDAGNAMEKDISKKIKAFFDEKYGPTWHCFVGSDFRAFVTHESKHFIFFYVGKVAICLYKCGC